MIARAVSRAAPPPLAAQTDDDAYRPGVCNIGPEEIARRRRAGHIGALATILTLAALLLLDAPPIARLLLVLPAAGAAVGYLQAWLRFCAGFGAAGVFNLGPLGGSSPVVDEAARARDRVRAFQIALSSLLIGIVVGVATLALPA